MRRRAVAWLLAAAAWPVVGGAAPAQASPQAPARAVAPWPDTPNTREFRRRVLDLAVLYGTSSGLDPNGYMIATTDLGVIRPGCHRVRARTSLAGTEVGNEVFEVCKP
ncbi:MAG: hypothetical protein KIS62_17995 [Ramlibacter sp.]|nr:hypothetical protein [Ramlibacter sp.]